MFWSMKENAGGMQHLADGWLRMITGKPCTHFFERLKSKTTDLRLVTDESQRPIVCKLCGFAQVRLRLSNGWEIEACSAAAYRAPLDSERLEALSDKLSESAGVKVNSN